MLNALKRYEIQLLLSVGHTQAEVAKFAGVGERSVRRVAREAPVMPLAAMVEEVSRSVGRPSLDLLYGNIAYLCHLGNVEVFTFWQ